MTLIIPVLLSGGTGTRLWPLSREAYPKQLLPLVGTRSLLQETAARVSDATRYRRPIVVANVEHRFVIAEQFRTVAGEPPRIVLEPMGKNTAPAIAVGALLGAREDPEAMMLVMPADHVIGDMAAFHAAVDAGGWHGAGAVCERGVAVAVRVCG